MRVCKKAIFRHKVVKFQTQRKKEKCQMLPGKKQHRLPTANTSQSDWCRLRESQAAGCEPYPSFLAAGLLLTLLHIPCPLCGEQWLQQSCTVDIRVTWVNVHKALAQRAHYVRLSSYCYVNIRGTQASETVSQQTCLREKWHKIQPLGRKQEFSDMWGHSKFIPHKPSWKELPNGMLQQPQKWVQIENRWLVARG